LNPRPSTYGDRNRQPALLPARPDDPELLPPLRRTRGSGTAHDLAAERVPRRSHRDLDEPAQPGPPTTAISDTDTHEFHNLRSGGARSWTPSSTDAPAGIVDAEIARAVRAGKMVGGQGIYVQTRLVATDGSGGTAQLTGLVPAGTQPATEAAGTLLSVSNAAVNLEIRVQAPTWAPYDTIEIYRNAATRVAQTNGGTPTLFGAVPTTTLSAGADFSVATVPVNGSQRLETNKTVSLAGLAQDEWIVVIVKGTQGVSAPMFQ
jgi:hypothetical protein